MTEEEYIKKLNKEIGNDTEFIVDPGTFTKMHERVWVTHTKCGYHWNPWAYSFFGGKDYRRAHNRCPICSAAARRVPFQKVYNDFKEKHITLLTTESEYKSNKQKLDAICDICGAHMTPTYNTLTNGEGCMNCANKVKAEALAKFRIKNGGTYCGGGVKGKSKEYYDEKILEHCKRYGYEMVDGFKSFRKKLKIYDPKADDYFYPFYYGFVIKDGRSPYETSYKNEERIKSILLKNSIKFMPQYKYSDCKDERELPFDFHLTDYNILIEYDGEFHYIPIFGQERLDEQKDHDKTKTAYCKSNHIPLLRIPYWEADRIDEILSSLLVLLKSHKKLSYTAFENWRKSLKLKSYTAYIKSIKKKKLS